VRRVFSFLLRRRIGRVDMRKKLLHARRFGAVPKLRGIGISAMTRTLSCSNLRPRAKFRGVYEQEANEVARRRCGVVDREHGELRDSHAAAAGSGDPVGGERLVFAGAGG
jgi:hypothetical protein